MRLRNVPILISLLFSTLPELLSFSGPVWPCLLLLARDSPCCCCAEDSSSLLLSPNPAFKNPGRVGPLCESPSGLLPRPYGIWGPEGLWCCWPLLITDPLAPADTGLFSIRLLMKFCNRLVFCPLLLACRGVGWWNSCCCGTCWSIPWSWE